jgi:AraC-like DNA-binding protein
MGESFVSYSTNGIAPHRRVDVWNERVSGAITHLQVEPACSGVFDAHFKAAEFAGINFVEVVCSPTRVVHTQACARRIQDPAYLIQLQRAGNCVHRSASSEMRIGPGDFFLCDNTHPYEQVLEERHGLLILRIPQASLRRRLPTPEMFENRPISGQGGTGGLVSKFINLFWEQCQDGFDTMAADKVVDSICDLLAASFIDSGKSLLDCSSVQTMWRLRICRFIDQHLDDPELAPARIAGHFRVSPRYIHKLFASQDEAVSKYIQRRRLESAYRSLTDSTLSVKSVSTIAYEWGFSNTTHFARVFRERYGASPSDLRRQRSSQHA